MGWVTGKNRSIQHKSGRGVDFLGTCLGGNGLGRREKPIDSAQVRAPIRVAFECTLDHRQRPAAPQAAEPFGGAGLGLNSWAMISLMGTRVQHYGVHARDDVRW